MIKKCSKCNNLMYPVLEDIAYNSQSDETRKIPVWYCSECKDTFLMQEKEEIQATLSMNENQNEGYEFY